jgi:hypothetical protein
MTLRRGWFGSATALALLAAIGDERAASAQAAADAGTAVVSSVADAAAPLADAGVVLVEAGPAGPSDGAAGPSLDGGAAAPSSDAGAAPSPAVGFADAATPAAASRPAVPIKPPTDKERRATEEFVDMPPAAGAATKSPLPADEKTAAGYVPGYRRIGPLSLSPFAPQAFWSVPGLTPAFGQRTPSNNLRFDFKGYMQIPVRGGIGSRPGAAPGQASTTLHGDPVLPGASFGWFEQTPTVPWPWAQLNFIVGNDVVQATTILGAWNIGESMTASTYFQAPAQAWFTQAFLTFTPKLATPVGVQFVVGAFDERYGYMAQYTLGAYPSPFIGMIAGTGAKATVTLPFEGDLGLKLEAGVKGDLNHVPSAAGPSGAFGESFLAPAPGNNFASPAEGSTFAYHGHASLTYKETATLGLHYIQGLESDDRRDNIDDPATPENEAVQGAGSIRIAGADLTVNGGRFGYLYLGGVKVDIRGAGHLDNLVQVLNTGGGKLLDQRYLGYGSHGDGGLLMFGGQYTVSLGTLLRYPTEFWGEGPDLQVSVFGIFARTNTEDPTPPASARDPLLASFHAPFDGKEMLKYGAEVTYSMFPWLAAAARVDHVLPDIGDPEQSFFVFNPRLVLRSDWQAREALTVSYAVYGLGSKVPINGDTRLMNNASGHPDTQMLAVLGTMWW